MRIFGKNIRIYLSELSGKKRQKKKTANPASETNPTEFGWSIISKN